MFNFANLSHSYSNLKKYFAILNAHLMLILYISKLQVSRYIQTHGTGGGDPAMPYSSPINSVWHLIPSQKSVCPLNKEQGI